MFAVDKRPRMGIDRTRPGPESRTAQIGMRHVTLGEIAAAQLSSAQSKGRLQSRTRRTINNESQQIQESRYRGTDRHDLISAVYDKWTHRNNA
jgi:hypothetical protein